MSEPAASEIDYLLGARAVRERAEQLFALAERNELEFFGLRLEQMRPLAERVARITSAFHPRPAAIPVHGRYRHFEAGGVDRLGQLERRLAPLAPLDRLAARADLVIVSVLLDAGAGAEWKYREPGTGLVFSRSEGLAVASYHWFAAGGLSADPDRDPLRVDAECLARVDEAELARAFAVTRDNPVLGLSGRVQLLRRLGRALAARPERAGSGARPGRLAVQLFERADGGELRAAEILRALLLDLGPIWPGRESLSGVNLGDVWSHSRHGRMPFHKLSQWLSYSLCEPLEQAGVRVVELDGLTGLAEYRNGGLFVDGGVVVPKRPAVLAELHGAGSDLVIEWRALTVALLDRIAGELRRIWDLDAEQLPLAKVLEGGTWRAGRVLATELRPGGAPPIRIASDGTVF